MYNGLFLYVLTSLYYFRHQNLEQLHMHNRTIASTFSAFFPLSIMYNYYFSGETLLNDSYYSLLTFQVGYYAFDIIPVVILGDYGQISHHILGSILNYAGFIYRFDQDKLLVALAIYFVEQGQHLPHCYMKICDYNNLQQSSIRNVFKKIYFSTIKLTFFLKVLIALRVNYITNYKIAFVMYLQLIWNFYMLKKNRIL